MTTRKESEMQAVVPLQYRPNVRVRPSQAVYRRRRLVVLLCAALLAVGAWQTAHRLTGTLGDGPLTVAEQPGGKVVTGLVTNLVASRRVIVQPGDTLWSIARRVQPTGDVRPLVDKLDAQRHGRALQVGETIVLPVRH